MTLSEGFYFHQLFITLYSLILSAIITALASYLIRPLEFFVTVV